MDWIFVGVWNSMVSQVRDCEYPLPDEGTCKGPCNIQQSGWKHFLGSQTICIGALIQDVGSGAILLRYDGLEWVRLYIWFDYQESVSILTIVCYMVLCMYLHQGEDIHNPLLVILYCSKPLQISTPIGACYYRITMDIHTSTHSPNFIN